MPLTFGHGNVANHVTRSRVEGGSVWPEERSERTCVCTLPTRHNTNVCIPYLLLQPVLQYFQ